MSQKHTIVIKVSLTGTMEDLMKEFDVSGSPKTIQELVNMMQEGLNRDWRDAEDKEKLKVVSRVYLEVK